MTVAGIYASTYLLLFLPLPPFWANGAWDMALLALMLMLTTTASASSCHEHQGCAAVSQQLLQTAQDPNGITPARDPKQFGGVRSQCTKYQQQLLWNNNREDSTVSELQQQAAGTCFGTRSNGVELLQQSVLSLVLS
jgi:thiamine biosynthesis lipoprotein ApbE